MTPTERRQRFRAVLSGERCVHPGSVFDPLSARMAAELGFETAMFAGSIASLAVLGAPDLILLTLTEFADQARRICRAGAPPLLVDADHGYGNALNAMRTVQELETAGVAALTVEDTLLPRPHGPDGGTPRLIPIEEGLGKLRAALAAREDPSLVVVARTGAAAVTGVADAVVRARAYAEAGADALFFTGLRTRAELDVLAAAVDLPIILGGAEGELTDRDHLATRRVRVALQGHQPFAAAMRAAYETLKALREGTPPAALAATAPADLLRRLSGEAEYRAWTRDFLGGP